MADVVIGTRACILTVAATDYSDEVSHVEIASAESDSDFVSFADALAGGLRQYTLKLTIRQNLDSASLWYKAWSLAGTEVAVEVWPNGGGVTEGATTPKYTGTAQVREPDGDFIGGDASPSTTAVQAVEVEWPFTAKPTMDITP